MDSKTAYNTVDEYIAAQSETIQPILNQLREVIKSAAPTASEIISYGMPAFKFNSVSVWFAGYKNHIGLYPMYGMEKFRDEMEIYKGKGTKDTLQFPYNKPLPLELIARLVKYKFEKA